MGKTKKTFGSRVSALRDKRGISQEKFATDVKIPRRTIQNIEYDKGSTALENAVAIADFFGVSLDYLTHGREYEAPPAPPAEKKAQQLISIITLLPSLNEDQLGNVLSLVRGYTSSDADAGSDSSAL